MHLICLSPYRKKFTNLFIWFESLTNTFFTIEKHSSKKLFLNIYIVFTCECVYIVYSHVGCILRGYVDTCVYIYTHCLSSLAAADALLLSSFDKFSAKKTFDRSTRPYESSMIYAFKTLAMTCTYLEMRREGTKRTYPLCLSHQCSLSVAVCPACISVQIVVMWGKVHGYGGDEREMCGSGLLTVHLEMAFKMIES